ncbi:MAG: bacteriocin [Elusimicrobia bacterium]|nr:bacteriocin [Elusimicrobiota bacterium]
MSTLFAPLPLSPMTPAEWAACLLLIAGGGLCIQRGRRGAAAAMLAGYFAALVTRHGPLGLAVGGAVGMAVGLLF